MNEQKTITDKSKLAVITIVVAVLLHLNYRHGFVMDQDFWTIAGLVLSYLGYDVSQFMFLKRKAANDATDRTS